MIEQFRRAMQSAGIEPPAAIITDGAIHRFHVTGDNPRSENGWYVLYDDGIPAGQFGCWKRGISETWSSREYKTLTHAEKAAYKRNMEAAKAAREAERAKVQAECREWSLETWKSARSATKDHPYLAAKNVGAYGVKAYKDSLIIPVRDAAGTLHGLQFIQPSGMKIFKTGTAVAGCYFAIGKPNGKIIIAEGYATGATIHDATGHAVACAFNAGNLLAVAEAIRAKNPAIQIIIAADDDHVTEGNPGLTKGTEAAQAVNGLLAVPAFPETRGPKDTDFNDLAHLSGLEAVKACIDSAAPVEPVTEVTQVKKSLFVSASTFFAGDVEPDYLVDKRIERDSLFQLVGAYGSGKTFIMLCIAFAVATGGITWGGCQCAFGAVLYLAGEGFKGFKRRTRAYAAHFGKTAEDMKHIHFSRSTVSFDGEGLEEAVVEGREIEKTGGVPIALIVIDTQARHMLGDENSNRDGSEFVKAKDKLRESFPGSVVASVHHTGNNEEAKTRGRGNSAVPSAMETIAVVNKGVLTMTKQKDGEQSEPIEFKLLPVQIGTDNKGEPVTSCIIAWGERSASHKMAALTQQEKLALQVFNEIGEDEVLIGDFREKFFEYRYSHEPDAKRNTIKNAFLKAHNGLLEKSVLRQSGNIITLASRSTVSVSEASFMRHTDCLNEASSSFPPLGGMTNDGSSDGHVIVLTEDDFQEVAA